MAPSRAYSTTCHLLETLSYSLSVYEWSDDMNERDLRSDVHYLGSSENKWAGNKKKGPLIAICTIHREGWGELAFAAAMISQAT